MPRMPVLSESQRVKRREQRRCLSHARRRRVRAHPAITVPATSARTRSFSGPTGSTAAIITHGSVDMNADRLTIVMPP